MAASDAVRLLDRLRLRVMDREGPIAEVPLAFGSGAVADERAAPASPSPAFGALGRSRTETAHGAAWEALELDVRYRGDSSAELGLRLELDLPGGGVPRWLIPALFYGHNRQPQAEGAAAIPRHYPGYHPADPDPDRALSDRWSFRADRASIPAVFGWSDAGCFALATSVGSAEASPGLGFGGRAGQASVWLDLPYREEPVVYDCGTLPRPPAAMLRRWSPGETLRVEAQVFAGGPDPHGYDPFLRALYARERAGEPLRPPVTVEEAAELAAHGLLRWHFRAEHRALFETAAFDRELPAGVDRPHMHVAWVSGAPYAHALLLNARRTGSDERGEAAGAVLDHIAEGLAPCGTFWGEWRLDRGWSAGWTPGPTWLHARTLAEATLFMVRAAAGERERGEERPGWEAAARSSLSFVAARQRADGNLGAYYDSETGDVLRWDGCAGLGWISALLEGAMLFGEREWLDVARRAGRYYARYVEDAYLYGAPEDIGLAPSSEDGYAAVTAYVLLARVDGDGWSTLARRAADWTMTFRWCYDTPFPEETLLGRYGFRTRGADNASPVNQHLHAYGLMCLPEMLELWERTGDDYYLQRTADNLACFRQSIVREDGHLNGYRGMAPERYYHTDCFQAKGMIGMLSHAWSVGALSFAAESVLARPSWQRALLAADAVP